MSGVGTAAVGTGCCVFVVSGVGAETSSNCAPGRGVGFDVELVVAVGFSPCSSSFLSCRL